ncbi:MAG: hypothetical protein QM661_11240 [Solimonas sp.]
MSEDEIITDAGVFEDGGDKRQAAEAAMWTSSTLLRAPVAVGCWSIVEPNALWRPAQFDQFVERPDDASGRRAGVSISRCAATRAGLHVALEDIHLSRSIVLASTELGLGAMASMAEGDAW